MSSFVHGTLFKVISEAVSLGQYDLIPLGIGMRVETGKPDGKQEKLYVE